MNENTESYDWISYEIDCGVDIVEKWAPITHVSAVDGMTLIKSPRKSYMIECKEHDGFLMIWFGDTTHNGLWHYESCFDDKSDCDKYCDEFNAAYSG